MIRISDKSQCCGCTACMSICPAQCIIMRRDREGFDYPMANPDLCISCGKCEDVCPMSHAKDAEGPVETLAARVPDHTENNPSGGVLPALAANVIDEGGLVYGAVMNPDMTVSHTDASDMQVVERMLGAEYVQSELYASFEEVRYELEAGRKVIFTGTPCQIAGLRAFIGHDVPELLLVDFACPGVPGPGLWEKYVKAIAPNHPARSRDSYELLYQQNMTLRPSCYQCPFRKGSSGSDLTLALLQNVAEALPELADSKPVTLIRVHSDKGRKSISAIGLPLKPVDPVLALRGNKAFEGDIPVPERRDEFFKGIHSAKDIIKYMQGFVVKESIPAKIREAVRSLLTKN